MDWAILYIDMIEIRIKKTREVEEEKRRRISRKIALERVEHHHHHHHVSSRAPFSLIGNV
jgi:hypothetical protein